MMTIIGDCDDGYFDDHTDSYVYKGKSTDLGQVSSDLPFFMWVHL